MRQQVWVHKSTSFEDAERFERRYYAAMSRKERLDTVDYLRRLARKMRRTNGGTRLRRVITIVQ